MALWRLEYWLWTMVRVLYICLDAFCELFSHYGGLSVTILRPFVPWKRPLYSYNLLSSVLSTFPSVLEAWLLSIFICLVKNWKWELIDEWLNLILQVLHPALVQLPLRSPSPTWMITFPALPRIIRQWCTRMNLLVQVSSNMYWNPSYAKITWWIPKNFCDENGN